MYIRAISCFLTYFYFAWKGALTLRKNKTLKSDKNKNILWIEIKEHAILVLYLFCYIYIHAIFFVVWSD